MYIMTPVLKTSRRLLLCNIVRYTFPKQSVHKLLVGLGKTACVLQKYCYQQGTKIFFFTKTDVRPTFLIFKKKILDKNILYFHFTILVSATKCKTVRFYEIHCIKYFPCYYT